MFAGLQGVFVTGTDTNVGKTLIAAATVAEAAARGAAVAGIKPVASGCRATRLGNRSDDAIRLRRSSSLSIAYDNCNPYAFIAPVAPQFAAADEGVVVQLAPILAAHARVATLADFVVVEGAGGWRVPISDTLSLSDVAVELAYPVILVVGLRLGCINHALLTIEAIQRDGLSLAGVVMNQTDPDYANVDATIDSIKLRSPSCHVGFLPRLTSPGPATVRKRLRTFFEELFSSRANTSLATRDFASA